MKKKIVATLLASAMCMSMLAGCGSTDTDGSASTPASTPASDSSASGSSAEATPAPTEEPKLDFGGQVITWAIRDDGVAQDGESRYHYLKAIALLEEELNVDIQFTCFSGKSEFSMTTYLAAGDYPDLMSWKWNNEYSENGGVTGLYNDGIAMDLTEIVETKMPNLQAIFERYPNIAKDMKNGDGKYLFFQRINPFETTEDFMSATGKGLIIRQDWLDNVGADVPTDMASWYEALSAFKTMDPNGNGENDELPFDSDDMAISYFEGAYGITASHYIDPETGKVEYGARTQNYKAYLEEMNKWYSEGLICNVYDENGKKVTKSTEETIPQDLAGSWVGNANAWGRSTFVALSEKKPDAAITGVRLPATEDGHVYAHRGVSTVRDELIIVSTDCKNIDAVAAVVDWMYDEEHSQLLTWGEEGITFEYNENGERQLIKVDDPATGEKVLPTETLPYGENVVQPIYKMYGNESGYLPSFGYWDLSLASRDDWYKESSKTWAQADFSILYPGAISLSAEQADKVSTSNNASLFNYIDEMKWKFITGQEPLSNFDTYVTNLETMGISDIVAVYQEAYDEYMSR